jgi:hypothetical protein
MHVQHGGYFRRADVAGPGLVIVRERHFRDRDEPAICFVDALEHGVSRVVAEYRVGVASEIYPARHTVIVRAKAVKQPLPRGTNPVVPLADESGSAMP